MKNPFLNKSIITMLVTDELHCEGPMHNGVSTIGPSSSTSNTKLENLKMSLFYVRFYVM